jgi:hypothetical protein
MGLSGKIVAVKAVKFPFRPPIKRGNNFDQNSISPKIKCVITKLPD